MITEKGNVLRVQRHCVMKNFIQIEKARIQWTLEKNSFSLLENVRFGVRILEMS